MAYSWRVSICEPYFSYEHLTDLFRSLICLIGTVGMLYKSRSEFVPLWTLPFAFVLYPLLLVCNALVDLYGQADALVR